MSRARTRPFAAATALILAITGLTALGATPAFAADGAVSGTVFRDFNQNGGVRQRRRSEQRHRQRPRSRRRDRDRVRQRRRLLDHGLECRRQLRPSHRWCGRRCASGRVHQPAGRIPAGRCLIHVGRQRHLGAVRLTWRRRRCHGRLLRQRARGLQPAGRADGHRHPVSWARTVAEGGSAATIALPALAGIGYDNNFTGAQPGGFPGRAILATYGEVGSISSNVYQDSSDSIYAAATYKRQSALGPLGLGGIYRVTDVTDAAGDVSGAGVVEQWLDLTSLGINLGTVPSNAARLLTAPNAPVHDTDAFAQAGKVGIGGMTLSPDGNTLYFINLFDKQLYSIDVSDPANPPTTFESYDLGLGTGERPWAVRIHRGELYVGYVDSRETAGGPQPGIAAGVAGLEYARDQGLMATLTGWTEVLTGTLAYAKGDVYANSLAPQSQRWNTWTDTWTWVGGRVANERGRGWHIYPQPLLTDLFFDAEGFLTLVGGSNLAVFEQSDNQEAAWAFIEYLSRPEVQVAWYETVSDLPSVQSAWDDEALAGDELLAAFGEQLDDAKAPPAIPTWEEVASAIDSQIEQVTVGDVAPEDACAAMQEEAESIGTGL